MNKQDFVHLHVHTAYSLQDGVGKVKDYIATVKANGQKAIAITEHGNLYSHVDAYTEAQKAGIKLIIGCEMYICKSMADKTKKDGNDTYHLTVLAKNQTGYKNLLKLVSLANKDGFYSKPRIDKTLLRKHSEGLIVLSGCLAGEVNRLLMKDDLESAEAVVIEYKEIFGEDYYLEVMNHGMKEQENVKNILQKFGKKHGIKLVATNDAHYAEQGDSIVQDALIALRDNTTLDDPELKKYHASEFYLKTTEQMAGLFKEHPEWVEESGRIADKCDVTLTFKIAFPEFIKGKEKKESALKELCLQGWNKFIASKSEKEKDEYASRVKYELGVINSNGFTDYFLIVQDIMREARARKIPVNPGRGSAGGSLVSFLLEITELDPIKYGLYFERFLNPSRISPPDIDLDFADNRRDEIIEYTKQKYGEDSFGGLVTFGNFRPRQAIKDAFKVYGFDVNTQMLYSRMVPDKVEGASTIKLEHVYQESPEFLEGKSKYPDVFKLAEKLEGNPRHASTHASAFIITDKPITELAPLDYDANNHKIRIGIDMYSAEKAQLLKMDFLSIETLTILQNAIDLIKERHGVDIIKSNIPLDDPKTWDTFCNGNTIGIFQFESDGMRSLLKKARPRNLNELADCNAIFRPGAARFIPSYCAVKNGIEEPQIIHPLMEPILKETYGQLIYQEQIMKMCQVLAGFTLPEADYIRKAIGKKNKEDVEKGTKMFAEGCIRQGIEKNLVDEISVWFVEMARYNFNKSHALGYAMSAYYSAYVKTNYPLEFQAAMMNKKTKKLEDYLVRLNDGKRMGIGIFGPDINSSLVDCSIKDGTNSIIFGLDHIKGASTLAAESIVEERKQNGEFKSYGDFFNRCYSYIDKKTLDSFIKAGAFASLKIKRKWAIDNIDKHLEYTKAKKEHADKNQFSLFAEDEIVDTRIFEMPEGAENYLKTDILMMERDVLGFYASGSPLDAYADYIAEIQPDYSYHVNISEPGTSSKFVGIIKGVKVQKDKKGEDMAFFDLEDDYGQVRCVTFNKAFSKNKYSIKNGNIVLIDARIGDNSLVVNRVQRVK